MWLAAGMSPKAVDDGVTRVACLAPLLSGPSFDLIKAVGLFHQPFLMDLVASRRVGFGLRREVFCSAHAFARQGAGSEGLLKSCLFELEKNELFRCQ